MTALFEQGFFVREPAWHGLGVVLDDYPSREEAMKLAGHDWNVVELGELRMGISNDVLVTAGQQPIENANGTLRKAHVRSDTLDLLHVSRDSYERIPNDTAYEVAELLFDQGFQYETGITLDGGKLCAITLKLDEPITIPGDDSPVLPFGCLSWAHDGSASLKVRSGTIRQVCANTVAASEAEGKKLSTDFTFRHTKNWRDRVEDAKSATIIGEKASEASVTSSRVRTNIHNERTKINALFMGPTIPEAHKLTGYGLFLAGGEYFDHLRNYRTQDSYVKRTLLSDNPAKAALGRTIRELVAA